MLSASRVGCGRYSLGPYPQGFNLIELMVSMLVGMLVVGGAVGLIVNINQSNATTVESARLTQELRATLQLITSDVLRARRLDDPFGEIGRGALAQASGLTYYGVYDPIKSSNPTGSSTCIRYSYQGEENNVASGGDPVDGTDGSGTKYRAVTNDRAIFLQSASGSPGKVILASKTSSPITRDIANSGTERTLGVTDCAGSGADTMVILSSDQVDITGLTFAPASPTTNISQGAIAIKLKGKLRARSAFVGSEHYTLERTVTQTINIRSPKAGQ